jgi:N utilization substance protein B
MMSQLVLQFLSKPLQMNLHEIVGKDKWTYSRDLVETTISKADVTLELIKPKLKNWDADRIAVLDMLLIRMGICEFLYFETIPTKVTINEYIDLAKSYSTPQSGQFVNGILDNIHKDLMQQGRINKKSFRNSTL